MATLRNTNTGNGSHAGEQGLRRRGVVGEGRRRREAPKGRAPATSEGRSRGAVGRDGEEKNAPVCIITNGRWINI